MIEGIVCDSCDNLFHEKRFDCVIENEAGGESACCLCGDCIDTLEENGFIVHIA